MHLRWKALQTTAVSIARKFCFHAMENKVSYQGK